MKLYFDSLDLVETKGFPCLCRTPIVIRRGAANAHGRAASLDSLLVFLLLQRRRTLLFFYSFLDESDDLGAEFFVKHASRTGGLARKIHPSHFPPPNNPGTGIRLTRLGAGVDSGAGLAQVPLLMP